MASVIATPVLGLGLALKKISLLTNKKAAAYSKVVDAALKEREIGNQKTSVEKGKEHIEKIMAYLGTSKIPCVPARDAQLQGIKANYEFQIIKLTNEERVAHVKVVELFAKYTKA